MVVANNILRKKTTSMDDNQKHENKKTGLRNELLWCTEVRMDFQCSNSAFPYDKELVERRLWRWDSNPGF